MANPIWKDYYVTLTPNSGESYADYTIRTSDGVTIYSGRAYQRPDQTEIQIKVNDVCADFLRNRLPSFDNLGYGESGIFAEFQIWQNTLIDNPEFYFDWSYQYGYDAVADGASDPIKNEIGSNGVILSTVYGKPFVKIYIYNNDNTVIEQEATLQIIPDYNDDFNDDFAISVIGVDSGNIIVPLSQYPNAKKVQIDNMVYNVVDDCTRYTLYYVNEYGGWDFLMMQGQPMQTDSYSRFSYSQAYDNRDASNRGKRNYLNEVSRSWVLRTSRLTDDQAKKMRHLVGSTLVYLWDSETQTMLPVMMAMDSCPYKTFKSEGGKLIQYEINVSLAQNMIRR